MFRPTNELSRYGVGVLTTITKIAPPSKGRSSCILAINRPCAYIGIIGSRKKRDAIYQ